MSLSLLLDEHIPKGLANQIQRKHPEITIESIHFWRKGEILGAQDAPLLTVAAEEARTLVTFDQRTIRPLLKECGEAGISHGGVSFVDERTISQHDIGGLLRALVQLWDAMKELDWQDRVVFLRR
jgi:hypothetical protein